MSSLQVQFVKNKTYQKPNQTFCFSRCLRPGPSPLFTHSLIQGAMWHISPLGTNVPYVTYVYPCSPFKT